MSILCGCPLLECVYCLACARWGWKRCLHSAGNDSDTWGLANAEEFEPVPRLCRYIMAVYEDDLSSPLWEPLGGYRIKHNHVKLKRTYKETGGRVPPYLLYLDHDHSDIVLAIRGLNLAKEGDYAVLLDNKLGKKKIDGGYVHNGLLKAAGWILEMEGEDLKKLVLEHPNYTLTFAGHSLGSGVAAMLALLVVQNRDKLGNIERRRVRCFAIAPARCMSLNLAVRYADVINSVVLQDDFLPRTGTPLEDIFKSLFCLPCLLCLRCMRDTCISEEKMLKDPRRLYAPGRLYHIVERKSCRCNRQSLQKNICYFVHRFLVLEIGSSRDCITAFYELKALHFICRRGRIPPVVKTAVPVDGRFEHIVLSCNATSDHAIICIERESQKTLDTMKKDDTLEIPAKQKMERQETLTRHNEEHKAALRRAVTLSVPDAFSPSEYGTFEEAEEDERSVNSNAESSTGSAKKGTKNESWNELLERLFDTDESGHMLLKKAQRDR